MTKILLWILLGFYLLRRFGYLMVDIKYIAQNNYNENQMLGAILGILIGLAVDIFFIVLAIKFFVKFVVA